MSVKVCCPASRLLIVPSTANAVPGVKVSRSLSIRVARTTPVGISKAADCRDITYDECAQGGRVKTCHVVYAHGLSKHNEAICKVINTAQRVCDLDVKRHTFHCTPRASAKRCS